MEAAYCDPATMAEPKSSSSRRAENHDSCGRSMFLDSTLPLPAEEASNGRVTTPSELTDIILKPPSCPMPRIEDADHNPPTNSDCPIIGRPAHSDASETRQRLLSAEDEQGEQSKAPFANAHMIMAQTAMASCARNTPSSSIVGRKCEELPSKCSLTEMDLLSTGEQLPPEDDLAAPAGGSSHVGFSAHAVFSSAGGTPVALAAPPMPFPFVSPGLAGPHMAVTYRPVGSCQNGGMPPAAPIGHIACLPGQSLHPEQQSMMMATLGASAGFYFPPRLFTGQITGVPAQGLAPRPVMASSISAVTPLSSTEDTPTQPASQRRSASPRPGILRKRAADSQSKAAAAKSTSVPSTFAENHSTSLTYAASPPVKKTRKQLITAIEDPLASNVPLLSSSKGNVDELSKPGSSTDGLLSAASNSSPVSNVNGRGSKDGANQFTFRRRMPASYGSGYRPNGKSISHHFQRPGDVRVKEERRPTLAEVMSHRSLMHDLHGWKLEHISENLRTIQNMEESKLELVHYFQRTLPEPRDVSNDQKLHDELRGVWILLQSNIERSRGMIDQLAVVHDAIEKLRQNEPHVVELFNRYDLQKGLKRKSVSS